MANDFVFEKGEKIDVGSHGEHSYVYASGEKVPDTGISSLVFESGTGLGGVQYAINGGTLSTLDPVSTAESHAAFFDYDGNSSNNSNTGYSASETSTVLVHEDTTDGSVAIIIIHGTELNSDGNQSDYAVRTDWDVTIDSTADILVEDDPEISDAISDEYNDNWMGHGWASEPNTDGAVFDPEAFSDVTFTLDHSYSHPSQGAADGIEDFRLITEGGSSSVSAGRDGSIRLVMPV